jgi:hypothetical protein
MYLFIIHQIYFKFNNFFLFFNIKGALILILTFFNFYGPAAVKEFQPNNIWLRRSCFIPPIGLIYLFISGLILLGFTISEYIKEFW